MSALRELRDSGLMYEVSTARDPAHDLRVGVDRSHRVPSVGKNQSQWIPDIPAADDGDTLGPARFGHTTPRSWPDYRRCRALNE